ncbi:hypothetical protein OAH97_01645 [Octadecabacter sp.]|nr:hypothetical protein [Octadecabacter sp.]
MIRLLLCFFVFPVLAHAQPVSIRSGEHDTFSRLVLSTGVTVEWQIIPNSAGYTLELIGVDNGFDISAIFDRIPRRRILNVAQQSPNTLAIDVDCACHADVFLWRPDELVLDIIDGPDPNASSSVGETFENDITLSNEAQSVLPDLLELRTVSTPLLFPFKIPMTEQDVHELPELMATEAALLEGLARASSQGFLSPALKPPSNVEENIMVSEDLPDLPGPPLNVGQPGIGISTALDRDLALINDVISGTMGQKCLPGDLFEIANWADSRALHVQISALAEGLAGEFGQETLEAEDDLARLYIHFGFGAEARSVLRENASMSQSRQILYELADIVDDYSGPYPLIATQAGCPSAAAIWAFYAVPAFLDEDALNNLLQQFFMVPQPLRGQIAPRLARKFVQIGNPDAASRLLQASENHDVETTHAVQATRALIAEEMDDPQEAIIMLEQEVSHNVRTTPNSLIHLIELELREGQVPEEGDLELAATMRQENRGTSIEGTLAVAEARGRIALRQYQASLDLVAGRQTPDALSVVDQTFDHMAGNATDASFLEFGFADLPNGITAPTENAMARRLIDLGFPQRAADVLRGSADGIVASERRYLRAEAAIGMEDYFKAIETLSGMSDPRARNLLSNAYSGLGDHTEALTVGGSGDHISSDRTLEFRAAAWDRLIVEDDEVLSNFAQAILTPSVTIQAETLADRREILAQSEESRRAIEGLLLRFDGTSSQE